uniref:molybdopterin molybdotransferase n=1 Tax=Pyrodinium bahamense TaxID=73915 RepID=A0A7S0AK45_9DINO
MAALTLQIEAYAFRQLVEHLQWRSDVQNIDLMNLAGFCRNCLSKWYHAGAKVHGLPMEYADACERVYGEPYPQWKKRHQKPASEDQMAVFEASKAKHARTDPGPALAPGMQVTGEGASARGGHSSVCGQDCDAAPVPVALDSPGPASRVRIAVLTASDRASAGTYEDASGPAVVSAVRGFAEASRALHADFVHQKVVPDDEDAIFGALWGWSEARDCDLIVTTGGTGFGPRDVTPEATRRVIARPAEGLARAMAWQTSFLEPHSILSRGICGITRTGVLVVNLPGHPSAVKQCLSVLLPVLPQALQMLGA